KDKIRHFSSQEAVSQAPRVVVPSSVATTPGSRSSPQDPQQIAAKLAVGRSTSRVAPAPLPKPTGLRERDGLSERNTKNLDLDDTTLILLPRRQPRPKVHEHNDILPSQDTPDLSRRSTSKSPNRYHGLHSRNSTASLKEEQLDFPLP